jgi:hypothetical protein
MLKEVLTRDLVRTENLKTKRLSGIQSKTPNENIMKRFLPPLTIFSCTISDMKLKM